MSEQTFTIADLEKMVADHEASAIRLKSLVNEFCAKAGLPPRYAPSELQSVAGGVFSIRDDQFHGRPLATCVREYLEARRRANMGPASSNEIFDALAKGGYAFGAKNEQIARVSTYNSINKNPVFYKLPNKKWGLREWYPTAQNASENGEESNDKESSKANASESAHTTATRSPKRRGGSKLASAQILALLESDPKKEWPFNDLLAKLEGVKKSSATTILFRLQRDSKVKKVGPSLWKIAY